MFLGPPRNDVLYQKTSNQVNLVLDKINNYNVSLVKTRLRASRRGELPSTVGVRKPNPYENVRIFLECAIYQTHVNYRLLERIPFFHIYRNIPHST